MKRLAVLACALVMALGLFACSGGSGSSAASGSASASGSAASGSASASASAEASSSAGVAEGLTDFEWIAFQMPDGYEDAKESESYVTIKDTANGKHIMKFSNKKLPSATPTVAEYTANEVQKRDGYYTEAGTKTIGAYEWTLLDFTFNDNPSVKAYTEAPSGKVLEVSIFEMTIDDPAVQTVLSTLTVKDA